MPSPSEPVKIADFSSAPQRLYVDPDSVLTRGAREFRPKRFEQAKAAAALARPLALGARRAVDRVALFLPATGAEAERILSLLADFDRVTLGAELLTNLLAEALRPEGGLTVVGALGDGGALPEAPFAALSTSLSSLSPAFERRIAQRLVSATPRGTGQKQLLEEKPGKAHGLSIEDHTVKQRVRQWSTMLARQGVKAETPLPFEGFGLASLRFSTRGEDLAATGGRALTLAAATLRFDEPIFQMRMADELWAAAAAKLAAWKAPPLERMASVYLSVPSFPVTGFLEARLKERAPGGADARTPDLLYGWAPLFTGVELLTRAPLPAIMVHAGRFPAVHLIAAW